MPTDELEHELRRAFASAAAGYRHQEQARQRLLQILREHGDHSLANPSSCRASWSVRGGM